MSIMTRMAQTCEYLTPLGNMLLAATAERLVGAWFAGQAHYAAQLTGLSLSPFMPNAEVHLRQAWAWLDAYFAGVKDLPPLPPLAAAETEFRGAVRQQLQQIPYGKTVSYSVLAAQVTAVRGGGTAPRAIGGAVGRNPFSILVPCHRVVGADGSLTGYAGGIARKTWLLDFERDRAA